MDQFIKDFLYQYKIYVLLKKNTQTAPNIATNSKKEVMFKLIKITNFILGDNGVFIKKFSKYVVSRVWEQKMPVSDFLSILLDIEISPEFDFDLVLLLDLKIRFLVLFYTIFNFIAKPNGVENRIHLLPSLNQCIYEYNCKGKCPFCSTDMDGKEIFSNGYFYCKNCSYKHTIPEFIIFC